MTSATPTSSAKSAAQSSGPRPTKLAQVESLLARKDGASLAELMAATGWQAHSVRGVLAGTLKKKGHVITSSKVDGVRRYTSGQPQ